MHTVEPVTVATVAATAHGSCHRGWVRAHTGQPHQGVRFTGPLAAAETRDRIRAAVVNSGYRWPQHTGITIGVDTPHPDPDAGMDLAAAVAVLAASGRIPTGAHLPTTVFMGQLGLDGSIHPPRHLSGRLAFAAKTGVRCVLAPPPASLTAADQLRVWEVASLRLLADRLAGRARLLGEPHLDPTPGLDLAALPARYNPARRALQVAAAGGHHLAIATTAPWEADMLSQLLAVVLPDLDPATTARLARLYPRAGLLPRRRPHRPPWQSITHPLRVAELAGTPARGPGRASLTHGGVLHVHERAATGSVADTLCHMLDREHVTITAATRTVTYPARVQLVLALGEGHHSGTGAAFETGTAGVRRLLDRVDIHLPLPPSPLPDPPAETTHETTGETMGEGEGADVVAARVARARDAARKRWAGCGWATNRHATPAALAPLMPRDQAMSRLDHAVQVGTVSPRGLLAIRRLAVTIADLAGRDSVTSADVAQAYRLRTGRDLP